MKGLKKIIIASMVGLLAFTSAGGVLLTTNTSVTEAATKKNGWHNGYFYVNGKKATGYYDNYYLVNGKKANGFHNTGSNWVLFKNGLRCYVSGLIKNEKNGTWYAVYKGIVKWNYSGLLSNEYGMWQIKNGTVDFSFTGTYSLKLWDANKGKQGKQVVEKVKVVNGKVQNPSNLLRITFNVGCCPAG